MAWYHWLLMVLCGGVCGWLGFKLGGFVARRNLGAPAAPAPVGSPASPPAAPQASPQPQRQADRKDMVLVPAGSFYYKADQQLQTGAFYIDIFPVTNKQYLEFIEATKSSNVPEHLRSLTSDEFSQPVVWVSRYDADTYCRWAGKRLPSDEEWVRAARGDEDARNYPWKDTIPPHGKAIFGQHKRGRPDIIEKRGCTPHGCYDMVGNAWEWTSQGILRGGFYGSKDVGVDMTLNMPADTKSGGTGFRCVVDA